MLNVFMDRGEKKVFSSHKIGYLWISYFTLLMDIRLISNEVSDFNLPVTVQFICSAGWKDLDGRL